MSKKKLIYLLIVVIVVLIITLGIIFIINEKREVERNLATCNKVYESLQIVISADYLESNMRFIDNYNNNDIKNTYINLSKDELLEKGFVEYIQSTDYMIKFYSKITVQDLEIIKENEDEIELSISVKRPNLLNIMNACDKENENNPEYNFNAEFIRKIDSQDFTYEEGTYNIVVHKINDDMIFEYTDEFKNMLYGEND